MPGTETSPEKVTKTVPNVYKGFTGHKYRVVLFKEGSPVGKPLFPCAAYVYDWTSFGSYLFNGKAFVEDWDEIRAYSDTSSGPENDKTSDSSTGQAVDLSQSDEEKASFTMTLSAWKKYLCSNDSTLRDSRHIPSVVLGLSVVQLVGFGVSAAYLMSNIILGVTVGNAVLGAFIGAAVMSVLAVIAVVMIIKYSCNIGESNEVTATVNKHANVIFSKENRQGNWKEAWEGDAKRERLESMPPKG